MSEPEPIEGAELPEGEEAPPTPKKGPPYYCKFCGEGPFESFQQLGAHTKHCKARQEQLGEKKAAGEGPLYKGETDSISILEEILTKHPDITPRVKDEVMDWARLKGGLQPMELQQILTSFRGISQNTAAIIASKYSFALMKAQQEGRIQLPYPVFVPQTSPPQLPLFAPSPTTPQYQPGYISPPVTTPTPQAGYISPPTTTTPSTYVTPPSTTIGTYPPYPAYPQPQLTREDVKAIIRDEIENIRRVLEQRKGESEAYVDIEEPVRTPEGKIIVDDDNRPIVKRLRLPIQAYLLTHREQPTPQVVESKAPEELKVIREEISRLRDELSRKEVEDLKKEIETLKEQMVAASQQPTESPEVAELKAKLEAAEKRFDELKSKMEEKEKEQMQQQISALYNEVTRLRGELAGAKATEGYKDDSMRVVGQALSEVASVVKERKPVEVIIKEGLPKLGGLGLIQPLPQQPPPQITKQVGKSQISQMLPPELVEAG